MTGHDREMGVLIRGCQAQMAGVATDIYEMRRTIRALIETIEAHEESSQWA